MLILEILRFKSVIETYLKIIQEIIFKLVVRMENYRVLGKVMQAVNPNIVVNQLLDHLGDKKASTR